MKLGTAIKRCRNAQGISLSELAKRSQVSISHLSLIERDEREPSISVINMISQGMGVPASLILLVAADPEELEQEERELVTKLVNSVLSLLHEKGRQQALL